MNIENTEIPFARTMTETAEKVRQEKLAEEQRRLELIQQALENYVKNTIPYIVAQIKYASSKAEFSFRYDFPTTIMRSDNKCTFMLTSEHVKYLSTEISKAFKKKGYRVIFKEKLQGTSGALVIEWY